MNSIASVLSEYSYLSAVLSFFIAFILMPPTIRVAIRRNLVAHPNGRTSHHGSVPNVGGVNIFSAWFFSTIFCIVPAATDVYVFAGIYAIMMVGLFDDLLYTSPKKKLMGELLAGFLLIVLAHSRITHLHGFLGITTIPFFFSYALTFFVLILIVNATNLIDGVDGLASGLGIVYSLFFGVYFYLANRQDLAVMAFSLLGALIIFFLYNVYGTRNKIFMGDCGSLLLGFLFSYFIIEFCELNAYNLVPANLHFSAAPVVAIIILIVPLFDTLRVFLTRIKNGKSPFHPDKTHIHHLMLQLGFSHKQTSYILMSINVLFIILAVIGGNWNMIVLLVIALLIAILSTYPVWNKVKKLKS